MACLCSGDMLDRRRLVSTCRRQTSRGLGLQRSSKKYISRYILAADARSTVSMVGFTRSMGDSWIVLRPLSSEDAAVVFRMVDLTLSDEVVLSKLDGDSLDSYDVFLVESSAIGEKTPLASVEGVGEVIEEKSHCGIATASPPVPRGSSLWSSDEDLRMTTVELRSEVC